MSMMFEDNVDKSFLEPGEITAIDNYWAYVARTAVEHTECFFDANFPSVPRKENLLFDIRTGFAQILIFTLIHRLAQEMSEDKYFAVMLERLETLTFACDGFVETLSDEIFTKKARVILGGSFVGHYIAANNSYIRKAPSMIDCGFFQRKRISWAMQDMGRGLILGIGDYTIGYAILGAFFVNGSLSEYVSLSNDSERMAVYSKINAAFEYFYDRAGVNGLQELAEAKTTTNSN